MMSRPLLSVVIPTWNRAQLVREAIQSALDQRPGLVEVIVVDDGSTDNTSEDLARHFGGRIRLLRRPYRGGIGRARNAGVLRARGELLAFLDSDDLWRPGKLDAELRVLEQFPHAQAVISDSLTFQDEVVSDASTFTNTGLLAATGGEVKLLNDCPWRWGHWQKTIAMCSMTLRRCALARLGEPLFREDLIAGEDWELEMRIYTTCCVAVLPEVWSHVRRFDDGTRHGRPCPGKPPTRAQRISLLHVNLRVLERTLRLSGLRADIVAELENSRLLTAQQLAQCESSFDGKSF